MAFSRKMKNSSFYNLSALYPLYQLYQLYPRLIYQPLAEAGSGGQMGSKIIFS
jgi:hypothetical protein